MSLYLKDTYLDRIAMAAPGSTHYGYYIISYEFVYVGNKHGKVFRWETFSFVY